MTGADVRRSRRNALAVVGTGATLAALMLFPTSTNSTGGHRRPGTALAKAGIVSVPVPAVSSSTLAPVTVNGTSVDTRYGPVQVQLVVQGKRVVKATAIDYPQNGGQDREINGQAIPQLQRETLQAQGSAIDTVSGATFTSEGYRTSLQAALDAAHLG
jgi:uncharacterized protein with FMN-binding domain